MMELRHGVLGGLLVVLTLCAGCEGRASMQVVGTRAGFSTTYLDDELGRIDADVGDAIDAMALTPNHARDLLLTAAIRVEKLRTIYLPLLEAREAVNDSYSLYEAGRRDEAAEALEAAERIVLEVSRTASDPLLSELKRMEGLVAEARVEVEADSPGKSLDRLAVEMTGFVTRAGYFLQD